MASLLNGDFFPLSDINTELKTVQYWHEHNRDVLKGNVIGETDRNTAITKNCIIKVNQTSCNDFSDSTEQLEFRARHINYWKTEIERALHDINAEITILESLRQQLENAMDTLNIPEYITEECLNLRRDRMQSDAIYDEPQDALYNELVLINNVKRVYSDSLIEIENQMRMNVAAKETLERDWSNKYLAFKYETDNTKLETKSDNVKQISGVTRLSDGQSNVQTWELFTQSGLDQFKSTMDKSKESRTKIDAILINAARDLRTQDIKVNKALCDRIGRTEQVKTELENQLRLTLSKISETENILQTLHEEMLKVSQRIQVAQTRLNTKSIRPDVENCKEGSLVGLIDEVKDLNDSMSLLQSRSVETHKMRADLIHERSQSENEIIVKKKSLYIDNERCLFIRSHFQSAEKLCGF